MEKVELIVVGISKTQDNGNYQVLLYDDNSDYTVPIVIGGFEAQIIAIELEGIETPRPLTHDLILKILDNVANDSISEVIIYSMDNGIFYSRLVMESGKEIEARTSDAIALALKQSCSIFINSDIVDQTGIKYDDIMSRYETNKDENKDENNKKKQEKSDNKMLKDKSKNELEKLLNQAINNEEYEKASEIKNELDNRKNNK